MAADLDDVFRRLAGSPFRARFRLGEKERHYLAARDLGVVLAHAADFVVQKLAAAHPKNDGKQTPMRGHPVFIAQHATATCCRGCLEKWHGLAAGQALTAEEQAYVVAVIAAWLKREVRGMDFAAEAQGANAAAKDDDPQGSLF